MSCFLYRSCCFFRLPKTLGEVRRGVGGQWRHCHHNQLKKGVSRDPGSIGQWRHVGELPSIRVKTPTCCPQFPFPLNVYLNCPQPPKNHEYLPHFVARNFSQNCLFSLPFKCGLFPRLSTAAKLFTKRSLSHNRKENYFSIERKKAIKKTFALTQLRDKASERMRRTLKRKETITLSIQWLSFIVQHFFCCSAIAFHWLRSWLNLVYEHSEASRAVCFASVE